MWSAGSHCVICPSCRGRLFLQPKAVLKSPPPTLLFSLWLWLGGFAQKKRGEKRVLDPAWLASCCEEASVKTFMLFGNLISFRSCSVLSFSKKPCLGLFCYFLPLFLMHGACQKMVQRGMRENGKDDLKDDHGFKRWLKMCRNFWISFSKGKTVLRLWHFSYLLALLLSSAHCFISCFSFFSPPCEAKCSAWQAQKNKGAWMSTTDLTKFGSVYIIHSRT